MVSSPPKIPYVDIILGGKLYPLTGSEGGGPNPLFLLNFNYTLKAGVGSGNSVTIEILDPQYDFLESLLYKHKKKSLDASGFSFRFGWRGLDGETSSEPIRMFISDWTATYVPFEGTKISVTAIDATYIMHLESGSGGFDPNLSISQAITDLFARHDIDVEVEKTSNLVGIHGQQVNRSDMHMLKALLTVAKPAAGGPNNYVVVRNTVDGKLFVRILPEDRLKQAEVKRDYTYGRTQNGQVIHFSSAYRGQLMLAAGAAHSAATSVDPITKELKTIETTQDDDVITCPVNHVKTPLKPIKTWETPYTDPQDTDAFASGRRSIVERGNYEANMTILGDPTFAVYDQINIFLLKSNPNTVDSINDTDIYHMSGVYRTKYITHTITAGNYYTDLILYRQTGYKGEVLGGKLVTVATGKKPAEVDQSKKISLPIKPVK